MWVSLDRISIDGAHHKQVDYCRQSCSEEYQGYICLALLFIPIDQ